MPLVYYVNLRLSLKVWVNPYHQKKKKVRLYADFTENRTSFEDLTDVQQHQLFLSHYNKKKPIGNWKTKMDEKFIVALQT